MPNRIEAAKRKPSHKPPGDYCHCASSRLHDSARVRGSAVLETYSVISSSTILVATDFVLPFPNLVPLLLLAYFRLPRCGKLGQKFFRLQRLPHCSGRG
jgi:hypothetical protein